MPPGAGWTVRYDAGDGPGDSARPSDGNPVTQRHTHGCITTNLGAWCRVCGSVASDREEERGSPFKTPPSSFALPKPRSPVSHTITTPNMSLGPLTTTFTPPATCTASFADFYQQPAVGGDYAGPLRTSNCFPPNYQSARTAFYSPASICPHGLASACSRVTSTAVSAAPETIITCCPRYALDSTTGAIAEEVADKSCVILASRAARRSPATRTSNHHGQRRWRASRRSCRGSSSRTTSRSRSTANRL